MTNFQIFLAVVLWLCLAMVLYTYLGYPLVVWCLSRLFGWRRQAPPEDDARLPTLSLLIAAYNEEAVIEQRLHNALAMDYPADKLEIVVVSDGSSDATTDIVRRFADRGVRLIETAERRGKAAALNSALPTLHGDVVMFSDANTCTEPAAARKLARWFAEADIGAVCGRLVLTNPAGGRNPDGLYWRYETFIKRCEGRLGALLGANGAIYALRHACYVPLAEGTILDDMLIPLLAKLRTDCAIVYDAEAVAEEETAPDVRAEFHRRARIGTGGYTSIGQLWRLLSPRHGWAVFTFFSHKILRWLCPFFLLGLLGTNTILRERYGWLLVAQMTFYVVSFLAIFLPGQSRPVRLLRLTTMFTSMNGALLVGFGRWLCGGGRKGVWKRTVRLAEAQATAE
jgi:cellulose synthase/poly-beta-1,6-N-acetylglucosamine synthase-like glycosyltransferase